jgi:hypothetical protein
MPADSTTTNDWRKGRRRVHFVSGDTTRVGDVVDGSGEGSADVDERRRKWSLQEIYASAAGNKRRVAELAKAGLPPTLKEALADERLIGDGLPRWRHALPPAGSLPGEAAPLLHESGRTRPVSADEALGILRRKRRREIIEQYANAVGDSAASEALAAAGYPPTAEAALTNPEMMIEQLPGFGSRKLLVNFRFPPQLKAMADAAAELAGTNVTAMTELLWWQFLHGAPMGPQEFEDRTAEYLQATVGSERDEERKKKQFRPKGRD